MKPWLFHPFRYVAGAKALGIGVAAMVLTAAIGYCSKTHFDGAIDWHVRALPEPLAIHMAEMAIDWLCVTGFFYLAGVVFSRSSIRIIDVAGTTAMARWPLVFAALLAFGIKMPVTNEVSALLDSITGLTIALGLIAACAIVWMIALLYNAFTISCNLKGSKAVLSFIAALLLAEVVSLFVIHSVLIDNIHTI